MSIAGDVIMNPPTVSRWPVRALIAVTSQVHRLPNSCVEIPTRP